MREDCGGIYNELALKAVRVSCLAAASVASPSSPGLSFASSGSKDSTSDNLTPQPPTPTRAATGIVGRCVLRC